MVGKRFSSIKFFLGLSNLGKDESGWDGVSTKSPSSIVENLVVLEGAPNQPH